MRPPSIPVCEQGFTLVEMLVSLALMGFAAALLTAGVGMAGIISKRQQTGDQRLDTIASAQMLLRDRIERMRPVTSPQTTEPIIDAHGTDVSFDFVGDPLDSAGPDTLQHYRLMRTPAGDVILYSLSDLDSRTDPHDPHIVGWTPLPLVQGTTALSIAYYGATLQSDVPAWQSAWFDRRQPPDLVRVSIAFPAGDLRVWPPLVIRPRATVNAACRLDKLTGRCAATTT